MSLTSWSALGELLLLFLGNLILVCMLWGGLLPSPPFYLLAHTHKNTHHWLFPLNNSTSLWPCFLSHWSLIIQEVHSLEVGRLYGFDSLKKININITLSKTWHVEECIVLIAKSTTGFHKFLDHNVISVANMWFFLSYTFNMKALSVLLYLLFWSSLPICFTGKVLH